PSPLILVEAESPASVEFLKNANLLLQELNLLALLLIQPSSDRKQQHLHWRGQHGPQGTVPNTAPPSQISLSTMPSSPDLSTIYISAEI
ncbi:MAG: hypothetical protein V3W34_14720, partial [Phycisphaerae bacterium]